MDMAHIWHNPDLVNWLMFLAAVAGVVATLVASRLGQPRRQLTYHEHSRTRLPELPENPARRSIGALPQLTWNAQPVRDVTFLDLELRNTGGVALRPDQFERALGIGFGPDARVLTVMLPPEAPGTPAVQAAMREGRVTIPPLLLNPGEAVRLQAFVAHAADAVALDVRVADLPPVQRGLSRSAGRLRALLRDLLLACGVGAALSGAWLALLHRRAAGPGDYAHLSAQFAAEMILVTCAGMPAALGLAMLRDWADRQVRRRYGL